MSDNPEWDDRRQLFADLKAELYKRQLSNAENFDKAVLMYSSAGLALSLGFLKDFVPITIAHFGWLLYTSWALFVLAIVATIISYVSSQRGITKQLLLAERYYLSSDEHAFSEQNFWAELTDRLNYAAGGLFLFGVVVTTVFVSVNLQKASGMKSTSIVSIEGGASVPTLLKVPRSASDSQRGAPIPPMQKVPQAVPTQLPQTPNHGQSPNAAPSAPQTGSTSRSP